MKEYDPRTTIPIDTLRVARKVMTGSNKTLTEIVRTVLLAEDVPCEVDKVHNTHVTYVGKNEYADRKATHPRLTLQSTKATVDRFNNTARYNQTGIADYVSGVELVDVNYEPNRHGQLILGATFSDAAHERFAHEQQTSIDLLLDEADIELTDPIRSWRNQVGDSLWLPVVALDSADQANLEDIAEELTGTLAEAVTGMQIDLFETRAATASVLVPFKS